MPANTQFPSGEDNLGVGSAHVCADALTLPCSEDPANKLVLFSTAGLVDVKSNSEFTQDGYERFHNERGSTKDIVLDTSVDVTARIYMSLDLHGWIAAGGETNCIVDTPRDVGCPYPYWGWDPGGWPQWVVEATLYYAVLGDHGSNADKPPDVVPALADGSAVVVAHGRTSPTDILNGLPGHPNVHAFDVNLGPAKVSVIPKEANFFLVYSWHSEAGTPSSNAQWRIWTGEFFPNRFHLPVKNAFDVEHVVPQFVHDRLAVLGVINTPWGSYDIDPDSIRLTIRDASGQDRELVRVLTYVDGSVAHGAHYKPVNVTYVWDHLADGAPPGRYEAQISATNRQGSAAGSCVARFEILPGGAAGPVSPGRCGVVSVEAPTPSPPSTEADEAQGPPDVRARPPILPVSLGGRP